MNIHQLVQHIAKYAKFCGNSTAFSIVNSSFKIIPNGGGQHILPIFIDYLKQKPFQ